MQISNSIEYQNVIVLLCITYGHKNFGISTSKAISRYTTIVETFHRLPTQVYIMSYKLNWDNTSILVMCSRVM